MARKTSSSLINLNFSITEKKISLESQCQWRPSSRLSIVILATVVATHWTCVKDYWNCAKFLSNSESHDFICHNLADLTTTTTTGATLSTVGQWLRCVFLPQVVEVINYEVSVIFLTAQRPPMSANHHRYQRWPNATNKVSFTC